MTMLKSLARYANRDGNFVLVVRAALSAKCTRDAHYVGFALNVIQLARCARRGSTEEFDSLASVTRS